MQLLSSVPVLACNNIAATLHFYQEAFQFIIVNQRKSEQGLEWVYLKSGDTLLMLENSQLAPGQGMGRSRLYLYSDDAAGTHHFLRARGLQVSDLRTTEYKMREFDISDPEGHCLTIGQQITENQPVSD